MAMRRGLGAAGTGGTKARRVILISIDNLRADCLAANPDKTALQRFRLERFPATPTLDGLAARGTAFFRCFVAAPYTTASHASILTGAFPARHGVREYYRHGLSPAVPTLFELFRTAGYTTLLATDFPFLIGPNLGFTRAVDHFVVENDADVIDRLRARPDEPLFAFVHFGSVHNPFGLTSLEVDGDYFVHEVESLAARLGVPERKEMGPEWIERPRSTRESLLRQRYFRCTDLMYEQGRYDELMALYVKGVEYFDTHRFRRFVERLELAGLLDEAVIAVVADHGEEYSERAFAHYNGLWEGVVNVPLLLLGRGIPPSRVEWSPCRTVDLAPSLLELAGVDGDPSRFDGLSLCPGLRGEGHHGKAAHGETWFGHTDRILSFMTLCQSSGRLLKAGSMATTRLEYLRTERWKLIAQTDLETQATCYRLYDLVGDRREEHDVAEEWPGIVDRMATELAARQSEAAGPELHLEAGELANVARGLKKLGYLKAPETS
jgi:choline-sulfatase